VIVSCAVRETEGIRPILPKQDGHWCQLRQIILPPSGHGLRILTLTSVLASENERSDDVAASFRELSVEISTLWGHRDIFPSYNLATSLHGVVGIRTGDSILQTVGLPDIDLLSQQTQPVRDTSALSGLLPLWCFT